MDMRKLSQWQLFDYYTFFIASCDRHNGSIFSKGPLAILRIVDELDGSMEKGNHIYFDQRPGYVIITLNVSQDIIHSKGNIDTLIKSLKSVTESHNLFAVFNLVLEKYRQNTQRVMECVSSIVDSEWLRLKGLYEWNYCYTRGMENLNPPLLPAEVFMGSKSSIRALAVMLSDDEDEMVFNQTHVGDGQWWNVGMYYCSSLHGSSKHLIKADHPNFANYVCIEKAKLMKILGDLSPDTLKDILND